MKKLKQKISKLVTPKSRKKGYQTYEPLGITGQRPTEERFNLYRIKEILKPDFEVLDIGCNSGFFSLHTSQYVKSVHGVEPNKSLNEACKLLCNYLNVDNVKIFSKRWREFKAPIRYDLVMSLAVHKWAQMSFGEHIEKIKNMLKPQGYLLIESHHKIIYEEDAWDKKVKLIESKGFTQLWKGDSSEVGRPREFVMFRFT
jgi:cyclopropane fatty-acyl-phospholipid synthase-like methyltransferase